MGLSQASVGKRQIKEKMGEDHTQTLQTWCDPGMLDWGWGRGQKKLPKILSPQ